MPTLSGPIRLAHWLEKLATKNRQAVPELLQMATDNGDLVKINKEIYFHHKTMEQIQQTLTTEIQKNDGLTISEIRQILDTTRKYAIPLCEFLDSIGFTKRDGDKRVLAGVKAEWNGPTSCSNPPP